MQKERSSSFCREAWQEQGLEEYRKEQANEQTDACAWKHIQVKEQTCACVNVWISSKVCDHKHYTCWIQLAVTKVLSVRHCLDCCRPCNTAVGPHWQSRGRLWADPNTALLLTSGLMPQPWGQLRVCSIADPQTIVDPLLQPWGCPVDPLLQPWGCPVDPTPAILWPKANISLGLVVNVS